MTHLSREAITARLRAVAAQADLRPDHRLDAKLDMSDAGITARLREAAALLVLTRRLADVGERASRSSRL